MKTNLTLLFFFFSIAIIKAQVCTPESIYYDQLNINANFDSYVISDVICDNCAPAINKQIVADNFILTENNSVNNVCWIGGFDELVGDLQRGINTRGDACLNATLQVNITYYNDNGGEPGSIIASYNVTPAYEEIGGIGPHPVCLFSATHPVTDLILNNQYWISISGNESASCDFYMVYESSSSSARTNGPSSFMDGFLTQQNDGNWASSNTDINNLFLVGFRPANNIPVLSEWGLLVSLLLILIFGSLVLTQKLAILKLD